MAAFILITSQIISQSIQKIKRSKDQKIIQQPYNMDSIADSSNVSPQTGIDRLKAIQEIVEASVGAASTDLRKVIKHVCSNL